MPFKRQGTNDFTSPSGRHFNLAQVRLWYARGGKFPGQKGRGELAAHQKGVQKAIKKDPVAKSR